MERSCWHELVYDWALRVQPSVQITHVFKTRSFDDFWFSKIICDSHLMDALSCSGIDDVNITMVNKVNTVWFLISLIFEYVLQLLQFLNEWHLVFFQLTPNFLYFFLRFFEGQVLKSIVVWMVFFVDSFLLLEAEILFVIGVDSALDAWNFWLNLCCFTITASKVKSWVF